MKTLIKSPSLIAILMAIAQIPAYAATELTGCAAKRDEITQQIQQAQDNPQRRISLEKALDEVNAHCTDSSLAKQRNRKVINAQIKVNEAERALHKAESEHRAEKKLQKLREKYAYAKKQLADAEAELKR
jgi:predicted house-cleaning NTP pyrophosphatase (Maf/HAM1 superfamily)